ncbi:MAG: potassium/proton antiporter [Rubrivivax sp.]
MDFVNLPLFAAAALVLCSVLAGLYSARIGFSFLLVFLLAGVLAGEDGPGRFRFDDYRLSFWVGNLALAVILLDGGLRTSLRTVRIGLRPAGVLATFGVFICAGITAVAGVYLAGLGWGEALLLGAIVGSTDAAAVFSLLQRSGVRLSPRVEAPLEIESGVNDPMAVFLTVAMLGLLGGSIDGAPSLVANGRKDWIDLLQVFALQLGLGALIGVGSGFGMALLLRRVAAHGAGSAQALLLGAAGLAVFSLTGLLGGSGFLAVYLFGLLVSNRAADAVGPTLAAMDGYAWLAQAGMFLLLGLLVTPSDLAGRLGPALEVAAVLMLVARPVAIWLACCRSASSPMKSGSSPGWVCEARCRWCWRCTRCCRAFRMPKPCSTSPSWWCWCRC